MADPFTWRVDVIEAPAPIIDLADAKQHLRVDHDDDDTLIGAMLAAAVGHIDGPDGWLGRCLGVQTLEASAEAFPCAGSVVVSLPYGPVIDIVSIAYRTASGADQLVSSASYGKVGVRGLYPKPGFVWPSTNGEPAAVRILYRAGYDGEKPGTGALPAPLRAAILLMLGDLYASRETVVAGNFTKLDLSVTVDRLLAPFRVFA